jgi:ABC-2 type transport system permease protein
MTEKNPSPTLPRRGSRSRLRAYARFLATTFSVNFQAVIEYRANFLLQVFGMMLNNAAFALFWSVLIQRTGGIGGYGFGDVMFIWALVSSSFGLAHVVFGNIRSLGRIVQKGELDLYLLQPKDVFLNVISSKTVVSAWGDLLYGFIVLALLPDLSLGKLALFAAFTLSGGIIFAATFAAAESLSLFIGNSQAFSSAITEFMLSFSLYPETIFHPAMRWLFYSLLPSGFIAFIPLAAYRSLNWLTLPLVFLVAAAYATASYLFFRLGLRRYESGNQMGARI